MTYEQAVLRAKILKALSHPARILMVDAMRRGEKTVNELAELVDLDQSVVSRHLSRLKGLGIVDERREGVSIHHRLACPCILDALACTMGVINRQRAKKS